MASTPAGTTGTSCGCSSFFFLWFSSTTHLPHACKAGERCFVSCQRLIPIPSVLLLRGRLARCRAYLKAPEPADVPAPLKAGGYQPLIQAAFQGTQARGTGPDDGYLLGSHVPRCGGGKDSGEASAGGSMHLGECGAWLGHTRGMCGAARSGMAIPVLPVGD